MRRTRVCNVGPVRHCETYLLVPQKFQRDIFISERGNRGREATSITTMEHRRSHFLIFVCIFHPFLRSFSGSERSQFRQEACFFNVLHSHPNSEMAFWNLRFLLSRARCRDQAPGARYPRAGFSEAICHRENGHDNGGLFSFSMPTGMAWTMRERESGKPTLTLSHSPSCSYPVRPFLSALYFRSSPFDPGVHSFNELIAIFFFCAP